MSKIRLDAEPLILSPTDTRRDFVMSAVFRMPFVHFDSMEVDPVQKVKESLTQPAKLRRNPRDKHGSDYHLKLTRFNSFRVMVPVILAEADESTGDGVTSSIGCI